MEEFRQAAWLCGSTGVAAAAQQSLRRLGTSSYERSPTASGSAELYCMSRVYHFLGLNPCTKMAAVILGGQPQHLKHHRTPQTCCNSYYPKPARDPSLLQAHVGATHGLRACRRSGRSFCQTRGCLSVPCLQSQRNEVMQGPPAKDAGERHDKASSEGIG